MRREAMRAHSHGVRGDCSLSATICLSKALQTRLSFPALAPPPSLPVPVSTSARYNASHQRQTLLSSWQCLLSTLTGFLLSFLQCFLTSFSFFIAIFHNFFSFFVCYYFLFPLFFCFFLDLSLLSSLSSLFTFSIRHFIYSISPFFSRFSKRFKWLVRITVHVSAELLYSQLY